MRGRLGLGVAAIFVAGALAHSPAAAQTVSEEIDAAHSGVVPGPAISPPLKERWRRVLDPSIPSSSTVGNTLAADGRVFVTAKPSGGKATLYALDPGDGHTLWSREFDGWMRGTGYGGAACWGPPIRRCTPSTRRPVHWRGAAPSGPDATRHRWRRAPWSPARPRTSASPDTAPPSTPWTSRAGRCGGRRSSTRCTGWPSAATGCS